MALHISIIAPDRTVWDSDAEEVILPSSTGQLGILRGHAPLLTALDIGVMRVRTDKDWTPIVLMGGFAEVENDELTILVNGAEGIGTGFSTQVLPYNPLDLIEFVYFELKIQQDNCYCLQFHQLLRQHL